MTGSHDPQQKLGGRSGVVFAEERQRAIMDRLRRTGRVTVEELTEALQVSPPTVRSDLSRLEERGLLRRAHGGALLTAATLYEPPYAERAIQRQGEKRAIADAAAALVSDGETLLLDAGTTCHEIALRLTEFRKLTVVTNSLASAQALAENDGIQTILIGGILQHRREATMGALATQFLDPVSCDRAFVAVSGVHPAAGLTVVDFDAAQMKRRMIEKAAFTVIVADHTKLGQSAFARVGPLSAAHLLITDWLASPEERQRIEEAGLRIEVAAAAPGAQV